MLHLSLWPRCHVYVYYCLVKIIVGFVGMYLCRLVVCSLNDELVVVVVIVWVI